MFVKPTRGFFLLVNEKIKNLNRLQRVALKNYKNKS